MTVDVTILPWEGQSVEAMDIPKNRNRLHRNGDNIRLSFKLDSFSFILNLVSFE